MPESHFLIHQVQAYHPICIKMHAPDLYKSGQWDIYRFTSPIIMGCKLLSLHCRQCSEKYPIVWKKTNDSYYVEGAE